MFSQLVMNQTNLIMPVPADVSFIKFMSIFLDCEDHFHGCQSCESVTVGGTAFLTCKSCMDGLYLLRMKTFSANYPTYWTFCVPDCHKAHHSYTNTQNGECECKHEGKSILECRGWTLLPGC